MTLTQAVLLAIVQGLTELLPISSSGHLFAFSWLFAMPDQGLAFDIALHMGTLFAVIAYFFRDWLQILGQGFGISVGNDSGLKKNPRLLWVLAAATVPIGIGGLLLKRAAETSFRNAFVIGAMLILVGLLMLVGEKIGRRTKSIGELTTVDALTIGLAQVLAVVPGTSRSGITMTAGLFRDLDRPTAARFSFLLSTPAVAAAGLKELYDALKEGHAGSLLTMEAGVGIIVSALTGFLVIHFLMRFLTRNGLTPFIWYRIAFGVLLVGLAIARGSGV